ncbi:MAG TPA: glycoside hydrolase family 3 C-terminal domain-containing protein, partial [Propionibacteriaceae bacterium]|nr:glycoside hydrolase family 3 C-terminal domain-containing protein [Propionibacteriaceae bacterium]
MDQASLDIVVDDLLARLDDDHLVRLLHQHQPPVPELGLAEFHTGAEALHGVAWLGRATQFPQPVGLAATWNPELIERIGEVVGTELRAKHAEDPARVSLNCWAPVVNPLRNPLWGRNEEGYSEDPWVTADCATAYARGLRGDDDLFWRTVPTLKHLLAYNNETDRHVCSADLSPRVLHEYDLPAFLGPIRAGVVGAVMPSYNLVNGRPNHVAEELFALVREDNPDLVLVSDAYAPSNLHLAERYFASRPESHAAAVRAGLDSFTDQDERSEIITGALREALDAGLLEPAEVRRAARRLLRLRALTGEFTPGDDPWSAVGPDAIDRPAARDLARRAAAEQVVVLENDGILPLAPGLRVGIVGPLADTVKQDWYSGTPPYTVTLADAARELVGPGVLAGVEVCDGADRLVFVAESTGRALRTAPDAVLVADADPDDPERTGVLVTDWGHGWLTIADAASGRLWRGTDGAGVMVDSTRPQGWVTHEVFSPYEHADGTLSLWHRGTRRWLRVEQWGGVVSATADELDQAERFSVRVLERRIDRVRELAARCDVVVVALGNDPHLLGREAGDRPALALPRSQAALVAAVREACADVVLLVTSSYPYALGAPASSARAVVWTSHAGQELGHGVFDVLTGREEPRGRLAQTWWASDDDLAGLFDYDVIGSDQTYWYSRATPAYPFGHGLTYGDVRYDALELPPDWTPGTREPLARVTVSNRAGRAAHELVQVYAVAVRHPERAGRRLLGASRVVLGPGETRVVEVPLRTERLRTWSAPTRSLRV